MTQLRYRQGPMPARIPGLNNTVQTVRVLYETDPEIARAMLPKPLEPCARPEVYLQFADVAMHVDAETTIHIGALTCAVMCEYEGRRGGYVFVMAMEGESVVTGGRERYGEPKKIAQTTFLKDGDRVQASCERRGIQFFELEGTIGAPLDLPLQFDEHFYCYKGMPAIATLGEFDGDVFLTQLNWKRNYSERRAFDGRIQFHESVYDPLVDVPVRSIISMEYAAGASQTGGEILRSVPGEWIRDFWCQRDDTPQNPGIFIPASI